MGVVVGAATANGEADGAPNAAKAAGLTVGTGVSERISTMGAGSITSSPPPYSRPGYAPPMSLTILHVARIPSDVYSINRGPAFCASLSPVPQVPVPSSSAEAVCGRGGGEKDKSSSNPRQQVSSESISVSGIEGRAVSGRETVAHVVAEAEATRSAAGFSWPMTPISAEGAFVVNSKCLNGDLRRTSEYSTLEDNGMQLTSP